MFHVYIDETHWILGGLHHYAWGTEGDKRRSLYREVPLSVSALTTITDDGHCFATVILGTCNSYVFETFFKMVLDWVRNMGKCSFYMDNCTIHHINVEAIA